MDNDSAVFSAENTEREEAMKKQPRIIIFAKVKVDYKDSEHIPKQGHLRKLRVNCVDMRWQDVAFAATAKMFDLSGVFATILTRHPAIASTPFCIFCSL
ncbi:unnamed protein product [Haemonchus placei]|uniref:DBD_Tnp_Mut domain-containing protein n=1 Tax=Haemonchus placei TaxID=6290 RepID=A0A0N4X3V6_HAEPC|nr:unnamed protein product [Haemonchus placei]